MARLEADQDRSASVRKHVQRATIILHLGAGFTLSQTLRVTGMSKPTVWRWWDRFLVAGVDGLRYDILRRRGRKPISADKVSELIALVMSPSPEHASRWTLWALAKKPGIAVSTMIRILKITGQMHEPHRSAEFLAFLDRVAAGIETCIEHHNADDARPFCRSKKPGDFVELWGKGHERLKESAS